MRRLNRQAGVPTILAIFPWLTTLEVESYPFRRVHQMIARVGTEHGFHVLDLLSVLAGQEAATQWVHPMDQHPYEVAHRVVADAMYACVVAALRDSGAVLLQMVERRHASAVPPALLRPPGARWHERLTEHAANEAAAALRGGQ